MHTHSYSNRLVVKYNISCGPGRLAFYNVTSLDLDPQVCDGRYVHYPPATVLLSSPWTDLYTSICRCVDYVEVDRLGGLLTTESSICMTNNQFQIEESMSPYLMH